MRRSSRSRPVFQQRKRHRGLLTVVVFAAGFGAVTFALADTVFDIADESREQPTTPSTADTTPDGSDTTIAVHAPH